MAEKTTPDALVLGGGGILGEVWMLSVLAGYEDEAGVDMREAGAFVGTSAGSIVAATLASGSRPRDRLGSLPEAPAQDEPAEAASGGPFRHLLGVATATAGAFAPLALRSTAAGGALVRRLVLGRMPEGRQSLRGLGRTVDEGGARFDGRLRVAAVDLGSGRRVVFGEPGAPAARVGEAVEASCAIPGYFRPVEIGERRYVDGGAWSPTNLDAAPAGRGDRVLCLNPTGSIGPVRGIPLVALGPVSRGIAGVEALALERRGAKVTNVAPDAGATAAIGLNLMDGRRRSQVVEAGLLQGRALARNGG
jgi:NTE family protein